MLIPQASLGEALGAGRSGRGPPDSPLGSRAQTQGRALSCSLCLSLRWGEGTPVSLARALGHNAARDGLAASLLPGCVRTSHSALPSEPVTTGCPSYPRPDTCGICFGRFFWAEGTSRPPAPPRLCAGILGESWGRAQLLSRQRRLNLHEAPASPGAQSLLQGPRVAMCPRRAGEQGPSCLARSLRPVPQPEQAGGDHAGPGPCTRAAGIRLWSSPGR